jgi:hypothetical protein
VFQENFSFDKTYPLRKELKANSNIVTTRIMTRVEFIVTTRNIVFGNDKCRCQKRKVAAKGVFRSEKIVAACRWHKCRCEEFCKDN